MLKELIEKLSTIKLEDTNNVCMEIARELCKDGFNMESLAGIEHHIMELARDRMLELGCKFDKEDDLVYLGGLTVEIALYLGINIGRNSK